MTNSSFNYVRTFRKRHALSKIDLAFLIGQRSDSAIHWFERGDRKPTLEAALAAAGLAVQTIELYAAEARQAWSASETRAVAACDGALHYSRRTAALALALAAQAGLGERFRALCHVCLSADVAEPLAADGAKRIVVASAPDETHLLAALERAYESSSKG